MILVPSLSYCRAYGLQIESELPLPELEPSEAGPEIHIGFGTVSRRPEESVMDRCVSATADEVHLFWPQAGSFLVRRGVEIIVDAVAGVEERLLRIGILGPALATLLQQRGSLVLHASAVSINGRAVAFVGWKGQGKSTTAAALFGQGFPLLTDDVLALKVNGKSPPLAHPSFPQFKLWPDSARHSLGDDPESLPTLMENYDKRARSAASGFARQAQPLAGIYVLSEGEALAANRLSPQETFKQLVTHTFCARYGAKMFLGKAGAAHMQNCAKVAGAVPVFKLERPRSMAGLSQLTDFIVRHFETL